MRIRVAHTWGHGEWFDASKREIVEAWVKFGNDTYGPKTHWIETE
jgi:hypothetical protein